MTAKSAAIALLSMAFLIALSGCEDSASTSDGDAGSTPPSPDGSSPTSPTDAGSNNDGGPSMLVLCGSDVMRLYTDPSGTDELVAHLKMMTGIGAVVFPDNAGSFAASSTRYFANAEDTLYMGTPGSSDVVMTPLLKGGQSYTALDIEPSAGETINLLVGGFTSIKRLIVNAAIPDVTPGGVVTQWSQGTSPDCVIGGGSSGEGGDLLSSPDYLVIGGRCVSAAPPAGRPVAFQISRGGTGMKILSAPDNQRNTQIIGRDSAQRLILIDDLGNLHDGSTNPAVLIRSSTCHNPRGSG